MLCRFACPEPNPRLSPNRGLGGKTLKHWTAGKTNGNAAVLQCNFKGFQHGELIAGTPIHRSSLLR